MGAREADPVYIADIAGRGLADPRRRAELADQVYDRSEALTTKVERLRDLIVGACDGSLVVPASEIGPAEVALTEAEGEFGDARRAAVRFLLSDSGLTVADISTPELEES